MENGNYHEELLATTNTKLAAVLLVFGAKLRKQMPLEWCDVHESRQAFLRKAQPRKQVTFNFENGGVPAAEIVKAYEKDLGALYASLESALAALNEQQKSTVRDAVSRIIARACRDALEKREFLVDLIKSMPEDSKWDQVHASGGAQAPFVRMGKRCSPELRAHYLAKI